VLTQLLNDTLATCQSGGNSHLIAEKVIVAEYERIVETEYFAPDPAPDPIANTDHVTVCKPREDFLEPLDLLNQCL
jgi:hypothetical protein